MTRPIKFRIWDKYQNKFLPSYGDLGIDFYHEQGKDWHEKQVRDIVPVSWFLTAHNNNLGNYIVQEYTGLKDSKNNEIYEGDILNQLLDNKPCYYVVEWGNQSDYCGFGLRPLMKRNGTFRTTIHDFKMYLAEGFEVIGNIFETPELLK